MNSDLFSKEEKFDRRSAWVYLIENASWKARKFTVGNKTIDLERGQLSCSIRYLEKAWGWSTTKVRAYLSLLQNLAMIELTKNTGQNLITICKYNDYQIPPTNKNTDKTQEKHSKNTQKTRKKHETNKDNKLNKDNIKNKQKDLEDNFSEFWLAYKTPYKDQTKIKGGRKVALTAYKKALKIARHDEIMKGLKAFLKELGKNKYAGYSMASTWLNKERWEDFTQIEPDKPIVNLPTDWQTLVDKFFSGGVWNHKSPNPEHKDCQAPMKILKDYRYR